MASGSIACSPCCGLGMLRFCRGCFRQLRGFDIIHLHVPFICGSEIASLAAHMNRIPLVVTYHNDFISLGTWRDLVFRAATVSLRHLVMHRAERVLFVSQGHAETSVQRGVHYRRRARSYVLENGVDTAVFSPGDDRIKNRSMLGLPGDAPVVGFVGGLDLAHHYKGLDVLLRTFAQPRLAGVNLLVVGEGELKHVYQHQALELGLGERVLFYGGVPQARLSPLIRACDLMTIPSTVPEACPLTLLESMACGVPVVASDGPGVRSLLSGIEDGLLVQPGDPADLAEKIGSLLGDLGRRQQIAEWGLAMITANYGWDQKIKRLEAIYQEVLAVRTTQEGLV